MEIWVKDLYDEDIVKVLDEKEINGKTFVLVDKKIELPKFQVVGMVERLGTGSVLLRNFGEDAIPEWLRNEETLLRCDGCKTRRHRERVFVVRDLEHGRDLKVYGRECLNNILRKEEVDEVLAAEKAIDASDAVKNQLTAPTEAQYVNAERYMGLVAYVVRQDGRYISKAAAEDASWEGRFLESTNSAVSRLIAEGMEPEAEDILFSAAARVWWERQQRRENDDEEFLNRVQQVLDACREKDAKIKKKFLRMSAWVVGAYKRHLDNEAKRDRLQEAIDSLGTAVNVAVGDKVDIPVVYNDHGVFETHFTYHGEVNFAHRFILPGGQNAVWVTTSTSLPEFRKGDILTVRATVKAITMNEYTGKEEVKFTRAKVFKRGEEPPVKAKKTRTAKTTA